MRISTSQIYQQGSSSLLNLQEKLAKTQLEIATGKKVLTPSDDPISAANIKLLQQKISYAESIEKNGESAINSLSQEEIILQGISEGMQRMRELFLQSNNSVLGQDERQAIGVEMEQLLDSLLSNANSQDANGSYIFSGYQSQKVPFLKDSSGSWVYQGDHGQRFLEISPNINVAISDNGFDLFSDIRQGNGRYQINSASMTNVGNSQAILGAPTANPIDETYTLEFALNASNELVYMVTGSDSGNVDPLSGDPNDANLYQSGQAIEFNSIKITISGNPEVGDQYQVEPSQRENIFNTIEKMIAFVDDPLAQGGQTTFNQLTQEFSAGSDNILFGLAKIGSRLNIVDSALDKNASLKIAEEQRLSTLQDADLAELAIQLQQSTLALQAAQRSFINIQNLSVFNFL